MSELGCFFNVDRGEYFPSLGAWNCSCVDRFKYHSEVMVAFSLATVTEHVENYDSSCRRVIFFICCFHVWGGIRKIPDRTCSDCTIWQMHAWHWQSFPAYSLSVQFCFSAWQPLQSQSVFIFQHVSLLAVRDYKKKQIKKCSSMICLECCYKVW